MKSRLLSLCAITLLLATSCATVYKERTILPVFTDFRPYTEAGFFVSSDHYYGEATPIGDLYIEIIPAYNYKSSLSRSKFDDEVYTKNTLEPEVKIIGNYEVITMDELVEIAVNEAKTKGANGLSNLEMRLIRDNGRVYYKITGLCLRIPEKKASAN